MINPRDLALVETRTPTKRERAPRHKSGERFLRGPIPMPWLRAAARAAGRGSGFRVAVALWYLSGLNHQARTVTLSGAVLQEFGVDRHAGYRGLQKLEHAGLVRVDRHAGRLPRVTILEAGG
jgi:hypothetical protein